MRQFRLYSAAGTSGSRHSPGYRMLPVTIYTYLFFIEAVQSGTGTRRNRYLAISSAKWQLSIDTFLATLVIPW